jgi:hypothetical protein
MLGARATGSVRGVAVVALGVAVRRLGVSTGLRAMDPHHSRRSRRPDNDFPPCLANALVARGVDNLTNRLDHELRLLALDEMTAIRVGNVPGSQEAGKLILSPQPRWPRLGTPCAEIELMI